MKRQSVFIGGLVFVLMVVNMSQAGISSIKNGSFEIDGLISPVTMEDKPLFWSDVNTAGGKFGMSVDDQWATHGYGDGYSLMLYTKSGQEYVEGDTANISQVVYIGDDVNEVIFDIEVYGTMSFEPWSHETVRALILIDGNSVWDSNDHIADEEGEYFNQVCVVPDGYKDGKRHEFSLALHVKVSDTFFGEYIVRWDFVKFDAHCGGFGYLPEDLNLDCFVNFKDFALLAGRWMDESVNYDLYEDGWVDKYDLMVFAEGWLDCSWWENWQEAGWSGVVMPASDLNFDGIVNFKDFAIIASEWGGSNYEDVLGLAEEWLEESWVY